MNRGVLLALGLLSLGGATALAPAPAIGGGGVVSALGRSMGGFRVALVDVLFLRAESLRRRGRMDEVPDLYTTVLELDPTNAAAFDHLAAMYAYDVLPLALDPKDRSAWWLEAYDLVDRGVRANPGSARLLFRRFDLLSAASEDPVLREAAARRVSDDPELFGLERLLEAVRAASDLPSAGRAHLLAMAFHAPQVAAERLRDGGAGSARAVAAGREALRVRGAVLREMRMPPPGPDLAAYLRAGLDAVEAVATARGRGDRVAARAAVEAYVREVPGSPLEPVLRAASE